MLDNNNYNEENVKVSKGIEDEVVTSEEIDEDLQQNDEISLASEEDPPREEDLPGEEDGSTGEEKETGDTSEPSRVEEGEELEEGSAQDTDDQQSSDSDMAGTEDNPQDGHEKEDSNKQNDASDSGSGSGENKAEENSPSDEGREDGIQNAQDGVSSGSEVDNSVSGVEGNPSSEEEHGDSSHEEGTNKKDESEEDKDEETVKDEHDSEGTPEGDVSYEVAVIPELGEGVTGDSEEDPPREEDLPGEEDEDKTEQEESSVDKKEDLGTEEGEGDEQGSESGDDDEKTTEDWEELEDDMEGIQGDDPSAGDGQVSIPVTQPGKAEDEVIVNDQYPASMPELRDDGSFNVDIDDGYQVDTEIDDYGNTIEVFAHARSVAFSRNTDTRIPTTVTKASGTISQFGKTVGGVSTKLRPKQTGAHQRHLFQGTARASFILTGGILDAKATYTVASGFGGYDSDLQTVSYNTTTAGNTIRELLIKAANEKIDDINGVKTASGVPKITERAQLALGLRSVFDANAASTTATAPALQFGFRETDVVSPKQISINFVSTVIFDTSVDYIRDIINEDSLINNLSATARGANLNAEAVAVTFNIRANSYDKGLKTNTNYEFIGLNKEVLFFPEASVVTTAHYLDGFNMTSFKTGKKVPYFETLSVTSDLSLSVASIIATAIITSCASTTSSLDFNAINTGVCLDYNEMVSMSASNVALRIGGTTIKFNTIKIYDLDSTITKIEMEDERADKYPVSLMPINEKDSRQGANIQVTGLQRSTPYTFRKLHITAMPDSSGITKTLNLASFNSSGNTITCIPSHSISLRTLAFSEPKLFIELDPNKTFVSTTNGQLGSSSSSSEVSVSIPKLDVELPNTIKMPAVKNDKTSLRYVVEVEKLDVTIGNLTVNGLNGNEKHKIEKVEGKTKDYFVVTLYDLSEKRDYGFVTLELSYTDIDGRVLVTRQSLNGINVITNLAIGSGSSTTITQFPDSSLDNTTGPELTGNSIFNVTLFEATTLEPRKAEIPVFVDDINGFFLRTEFKKPDGNSSVELKLENSLLKFTNLTPNTEVVYRVDFIWKDRDNKEQTISKYAKIITPQVSAVDVKGTTITTTSNSAEIVFELYSDPSSPITSVTLSDTTLKFTWDTPKLTLKLQDLKSSTEYKDLEISFRNQNGLITKYKIDAFKTREQVAPPTGNVAEFVSRIYTASLGRDPEVEGWKFWVQKLENKEISVTQFIFDVMKQDEFVNRFLSKEEFIDMMYQIIVGRDADEDGKKYWGIKYDEYRLQFESLADVRIQIASEMVNEPEFKNYVSQLGLRY